MHVSNIALQPPPGFCGGIGGSLGGGGRDGIVGGGFGSGGNGLLAASPVGSTKLIGFPST